MPKFKREFPDLKWSDEALAEAKSDHMWTLAFQVFVWSFVLSLPLTKRSSRRRVTDICHPLRLEHEVTHNMGPYKDPYLVFDDAKRVSDLRRAIQAGMQRRTDFAEALQRMAFSEADRMCVAVWQKLWSESLYQQRPYEFSSACNNKPVQADWAIWNIHDLSARHSTGWIERNTLLLLISRSIPRVLSLSAARRSKEEDKPSLSSVSPQQTLELLLPRVLVDLVISYTKGWFGRCHLNPSIVQGCYWKVLHITDTMIHLSYDNRRNYLILHLSETGYNRLSFCGPDEGRFCFADEFRYITGLIHSDPTTKEILVFEGHDGNVCVRSPSSFLQILPVPWQSLEMYKWNDLLALFFKKGGQALFVNSKTWQWKQIQVTDEKFIVTGSWFDSTTGCCLLLDEAQNEFQLVSLSQYKV